jgi:lanthionine-containing peptide SapB
VGAGTKAPPSTHLDQEEIMALLDLQAMSTPTERGHDGGGHGGGSDVSLALCDSTASVLLCL